MSTIEASSVAADHLDSHGHDHAHPSFLAHHFDTPEQQFDAGKLGIWLFLVTEVLFFSGMFCAYAIFRMWRPDVFEGCSQFLNTKLGAINTGVLLFSSLTMAWAVRCAQTEDHKKLTALLASTLGCAMVFLGVKAIEYSHKWSIGLLPPRFFFYNQANPHPTQEQLTNYFGSDFGGYFLTHSLYFLCAPFLLMLIGVAVWTLASRIKGNTFQYEVGKPLTVVCLSFFLGVGLGIVLESGESKSHAASHVVGSHDGLEVIGHGNGSLPGVVVDSVAVQERLAVDPTNSGIMNQLAAQERQKALAASTIVASPRDVSGPIDNVQQEVLVKSRAGVFFGIYYCMTGVHAIHIIGGIVVLVWLLVRSVRNDFNRQYFGPVDYVGLYWHIVDLIWIYLFPLLYLIR